MGLVATATTVSAARGLSLSPDVVVIGAGAAGLAAARTLLARGLEVVVIEAANRIGGRAYTESATFGFPYDQGCSWLQGPPGLPYLALADELGLTLVDHHSARDVLFIGNRRASAEERRQYDRAYDRIEAAIDTEVDAAAATLLPKALPLSGVAQTWIGPLDHGVDFADLSTGDVNAYGDYAYSYLVREGLGSLVAAYGRGLPVRLGVAATGIDWSGTGVRVETAQGTLAARACIVTVSTGVLGSGAIRFTPSLPPEKTQAIADVPMGLLTKIALKFDGERFGLGENDFLTYAVPDKMPAEACYFLTFPTGHDIAVGFVGGRFAWEMSRAGAAAAIDFALEAFVGMLGSAARGHFVAGHVTDWATNPQTLGAYSAARPGRHAARNELARPLGDRVFFAGEAVSEGYFALCSGAHLSGEAAAHEVAAVLEARGGCGSCDARHSRLGQTGDAGE